MQRYPEDFDRKVSLVLLKILILAGVATMLVLAADVLLIIFAGLVLAVFLVSLTEPISRYLKLSHGASLAIVILVLLAVAGVILVEAAPAIFEQVDRLTQLIPVAFNALLRELGQYEWGSFLIRETQEYDFARPGILYSRATGVLSGTVGWVVSTVIIAFIGFYTAANPGLYHGGVVRMFPPGKRQQVAEILLRSGQALRWWLLGRATGMAVVGVVTTFVLSMMHIPLAGLLGLISGLLTFIPNIGPLISAVPVTLIALMESPFKALLAAGFYTILQIFEGYILTPLILQRTVSLPPALLLAAQAAMGSLLGLKGVAMAAPMTVIAMVIVRMTWLDAIEQPQNPL